MVRLKRNHHSILPRLNRTYNYLWSVHTVFNHRWGMIYYVVMWSETLMEPLFVFANIPNDIEGISAWTLGDWQKIEPYVHKITELGFVFDLLVIYHPHPLDTETKIPSLWPCARVFMSLIWCVTMPGCCGKLLKTQWKNSMYVWYRNASSGNLIFCYSW